MKTKNIYYLLALCFLLNSCGVISHSRYGNGFRLNLFENWGREKDDTEKVAQKTEKTPKKSDVDIVEITSGYEVEDIAISEDIIPEEAELISENSISSIQENLSLNPAQIALSPTKEIKKNGNDPRQTIEERPMEPISRIAGILFYGSYIGAIIFALLDLPVFGIFGFFILLGFVLACIGLNKINRSGGYYAGRGLDISIIVIFSVSFLFSLLLFLLILAIFL